MSDILANILKENKNRMDTGSDLLIVNLVDGTLVLRQTLIKIESADYNVTNNRLIWNHPTKGTWDSQKWGDGDAFNSYVEEQSIVLSQKLTRAGRSDIKDWFIGETASPISHVAVGSGSTAFSVDDTALETEISRIETDPPTVADKKLTYVDVFNTLEGNGSVREIGLLNASTGGTLFNRAVLSSAFTKTNLMNLKVTQEITLSNSIPTTSTSPVMDAGVNEVRDFIRGASVLSPTHIAFGNGTGIILKFPYISDANTVILFHMNEDSGTSVKDISSYGNDGTATGTTVVTAYFDKGRDFNGSSDLITVADDSSIQLTNDYTIEMWVNADTFTQEGGFDRRLISKTDGSAKGYEVFLATTGKVTFRKYDAGGAVGLVSDTALSTDTWTHVACVQSSADGMKIYIDGVLDTSNTDTDATTTDTTDLYIGRRSDDASGHFDGTLDEIRVSDVERRPIVTSDTTMLSELIRNAIDFSSSRGTITGYHEATLSTTQGNSNSIRRTALFNAGSGGDMFMYQDNPEINKTQKMVILTRHSITFI
jgi:hypothetical protein